MDAQTVRAPRFPTDAVWMGTPEPLRLEEELRGRVVLLDFWTHCCVNCLHMLPVLEEIETRFADRPVQVVGVHAAKFDAEKDPENLRAALRRHRVAHPVIVDDEHEVWREYGVKA